MPGTEGDVIDLAEMAPLPGMLADDAFAFIGTDGFTAAGQLRWAPAGAATLIEGEVNGDGIADLRILVNIANYRFSIFDFVF